MTKYKKKNIKQIIYKKITKAILDYNMISPNDKLLIAVSGGKDSITLLRDLVIKQKTFKIPFTIEAIHIESDFCNCCKKVRLEETVKELGVTYHTIKVPIMGRLKPGRKMNCYWCSMQRRIELLKFTEENRFNKLVLGHHMDDIIETLFMNMFKGRIATMPPKVTYERKPLELIRPLAYVEEREIIEYTKQENLARLVCTCPYGINSDRKKLRKKIAELTENSSTIKEKIFKSMQNVNLEYLT